MAVCGTCKAETSRLRTIARGAEFVDECPNCQPQSFEKVQDPSTKKIWMGYEYNPNAYEKRYDSEGVKYIAKPEFTAEEEAKVSRPATDETEKQLAAEAKKRRERRTEPMSPAELLEALGKARDISDAVFQQSEAERQAARQAELDAWMAKAGRA